MTAPNDSERHTPSSQRTEPVCDKGGTRHRKSDHGWDGHEHPHNPWSEVCSKRLLHEPSCPDARCMTCDGSNRGIR